MIRLNTCGFFLIWPLVQITLLKMGHTSKCFLLSKYYLYYFYFFLMPPENFSIFQVHLYH